MGLTILEVVLGAIVAILITIWIENLRKPRLELRIVPPSDRLFQNAPASSGRFLYLELANKPLPRWARWMSRGAAMQCHGTITFHHLDGQNVFGRSMPIRWSDLPELVPLPVQVNVGSGGVAELHIAELHIYVPDSGQFTLAPRVDIYPGETERLDVAARFDNEGECYGWSNESYFSAPPWRNPSWTLLSDRYLAQVTILSAGERFSRTFRIINDVAQADFRLEQALPSDHVRA